MDLHQYFREQKLEKVIRFFRGKRVELPIKERPVSNKVVMNPELTNDTFY